MANTMRTYRSLAEALDTHCRTDDLKKPEEVAPEN